MLELLGDDTAPSRRTNDKPEAAALVEVVTALHAHPAVSCAYRQNSRVVRSGSRLTRFAWTGCPAMLGQLRDGRPLGAELKNAIGRLRLEGAVFLDGIRGAGGVASPTLLPGMRQT